MNQASFVLIDEGGPGSGHYGHKGRKGKQGGALPGGGTYAQAHSAIVQLAESLRGNMAFTSFIDASLRYSGGAPKKGAIGLLDSMMHQEASPLMMKAMDEVAKACAATATRSGGQTARRSGQGLAERARIMRSEWVKDNARNTLFDHRSRDLLSKGIISPEIAFFAAVNHVVTSKLYGKSVTVYRGIKSTKRYNEILQPRFPKKNSKGELPTHAISSWSTESSVAIQWSMDVVPGTAKRIPSGMAFSRTVRPSRDIIPYASWWGFGSNSKKESEIALIGDSHRIQRIF